MTRRLPSIGEVACLLNGECRKALVFYSLFQWFLSIYRYKIDSNKA